MPTSIQFRRHEQVSALESACSLDGLSGRFGAIQSVRPSEDVPETAPASPEPPAAGACYAFEPKPIMDQVDHFRAHPFSLKTLKSSKGDLEIPLLSGNHLLPMHTGSDAQITIAEDTVLSVQTESAG